MLSPLSLLNVKNYLKTTLKLPKNYLKTFGICSPPPFPHILSKRKRPKKLPKHFFKFFKRKQLFSWYGFPRSAEYTILDHGYSYLGTEYFHYSVNNSFTLYLSCPSNVQDVLLSHGNFWHHFGIIGSKMHHYKISQMSPWLL